MKKEIRAYYYNIIKNFTPKRYFATKCILQRCEFVFNIFLSKAFGETYTCNLTRNYAWNDQFALILGEIVNFYVSMTFSHQMWPFCTNVPLWLIPAPSWINKKLKKLK